MRSFLPALAAAATLTCWASDASVQAVPRNASLDDGLADYDPRDYVIGEGRGATSQVADSNALAEISKVFEVSVSQQTTMTESLHSATVNGKTQSSELSDFMERTTLKTSRVLSGAQIVKRRQEDTGWVSYAVLPKAQAITAAGQKATESATRVTRLSRIETPNKPVEEARRRYEILVAARQISTSNQELRVLGAAQVVPPITAADAELALRNWIRSQIPLGLVVEAPPGVRDELDALLTSTFTAQGLSVVKQKPGVLQIQARCTTASVDAGQPDVRIVRLGITLQATDSSGAQIANVGPIDVQGSGTNDAQAIKRALYLVRTRHISAFILTLLSQLLQ